MQVYIFLDVDGVLNHKEWYEYQNIHEPHTSERHWDRQIDPACVARVRRLVEELKANIVLSSTWRGMPKTEAALLRSGIPNWVGITPKLDIRERGHEIQHWMTEHNVQSSQILILDDDSDMVHLSPRLIKTNAYEGGLTEDLTQAALSLF